MKVNSVGSPAPEEGMLAPALGLEPQLPDCTMGLARTPLTGSGGRMTSVKGLACRERVLLSRCVIYVIIIIMDLAQEGHLLEAGGGHAEGSRGGLDPPPHVPPSMWEIKSIRDHLGWDVSIVTSRRANVSSARGQLPGAADNPETLMDGAHPQRSKEAPPALGAPYRALPSPTPTYPPSAGLRLAPGDTQRHSCDE